MNSRVMAMELKPTGPRPEEETRAALLARLSHILETVPRPKRPRSLQPTPEAAKSRVARLRRKRRLLLQQAKGA